MRRRDFISLIGGTAAWPLSVYAEPSQKPLVAFISGRSRDGENVYMPALQAGLAQGGFVDGKTMTFTPRWTEGHYDQVPALTKELVGEGAAVIIVIGTAVDRAAKATTSVVPIVFVTADDPVVVGLVPSLSRPSGNVTGVTMMSSELRPKMLEILHQLLPDAKTFFMLANPHNSSLAQQVQETQTAAGKLGIAIDLFTAGTPTEIEAAFAAMSQRRGDGLLLASDPFFTDRHDLIAGLAARYALPAIYPWREFAQAGGLISYGSSIADAYRQAARYAARILKGEKAADLPVMQPTTFELVINLKTAKELGIHIPQTLLAIADEVIE
jgi:putative tryptophan/tyrosine transport system substrate-binding protein